jgi:flagellar protein FliO/FliZ
MDTIDPARFILASFFVLGLLGLFALGLKRFGQKSLLQTFQQKFGQNLGQTGRLCIIETRYIDAKSKLVLVKRDNSEHLLLIGDGKAIVIEAGIKNEA